MENENYSIAGIGSYIPAGRVDNKLLADKLGYPQESLLNKIGYLSTAKKEKEESISDMCLKSWENLTDILGDSSIQNNLDLIVLVTQHPENHGLPHTSAIIHEKIGLPTRCFAFDISLGCSGFVAALATVKGYLQATQGSNAIIFTCDPYSESILEDDKNTALIFGDASTATLISRSDVWPIGFFDLGTDGSKHSSLMRDQSGIIRMKGRSVFNFCALNVPNSINRILDHYQISISDLDNLILHPGSKYIADTIRQKLKLPKSDHLPSQYYGNTISSSIPLLLQGIPTGTQNILSGFGVGLGWASCSLGIQ